MQRENTIGEHSGKWCFLMLPGTFEHKIYVCDVRIDLKLQPFEHRPFERDSLRGIKVCRRNYGGSESSVCACMSTIVKILVRTVSLWACELVSMRACEHVSRWAGEQVSRWAGEQVNMRTCEHHTFFFLFFPLFSLQDVTTKIILSNNHNNWEMSDSDYGKVVSMVSKRTCEHVNIIQDVTTKSQWSRISCLTVQSVLMLPFMLPYCMHSIKHEPFESKISVTVTELLQVLLN
jgi:hypothetical protein